MQMNGRPTFLDVRKRKDLTVCDPICFQGCSISHWWERTYTYAAVTAKYRMCSKYTLSSSHHTLFMQLSPRQNKSEMSDWVILAFLSKSYFKLMDLQRNSC